MDFSKYKIYIAVGGLAIILLGILAAAFWLRNTSGTTTYPKSVQNAINNPVEKIENSSTLLENDNFLITYQKGTESDVFIVTVNARPALEISKLAEQALLEKLGIKESEACNLPITIGVPSTIDENLAGYSFFPSFCPKKLHIEDISSQPTEQENSSIDNNQQYNTPTNFR